MADDVVVLDAWPVVEYYKGLDPAASAVEELLADPDRRPIMSVVNFPLPPSEAPRASTGP